MPIDANEEYRTFDLARFPLGENRELVYAPLTRSARTLPGPLVRLLQSCRTYATLDDHAGRLCNEFNLGPAQVPAVRAQLSSLVEAGLLISARSLLALRRPSEAEAVPLITALGVPTRNRPDALKRCIASYAAVNRFHGRNPDYVVIDDSDSAETRQRNRNTLLELRASHGLAISYAGPQERLRFAEALALRSGVPTEIAELAIVNKGEHPVATGANRNALLLHTVGDLLLSVDDDTVCSLAPSPDSQGGLCLSSNFDPTEFWFFPEGDTSGIPSTGILDEDLLGLHEQFLGREVGQCLESSTGGLDLGAAGIGLFRKLRDGGGRVLATAAGVVGDSGMASSVYFVSLEGVSRQRLHSSETVYRKVLSDHQVMRAVRRPTLCDAGMCMALNLGLDNRDILPPFLPTGRNQDGVFAAVLRSCVPNAFQGFLPWMVLHRRPSPRRFDPADVGASAAQVSSGQIIQALAGSFTPGFERHDISANLRSLGKTLQELGRAPREEFEEVIRLHLWSQLAGLTSRLDSQLRMSAGQPDFWAADARRILAALAEALPDRRYVLPADLRATDNCDALAVLQQFVGRFGKLLQKWPDLVEAARDLRSRQIRLACDV